MLKTNLKKIIDKNHNNLPIEAINELPDIVGKLADELKSLSMDELLAGLNNPKSRPSQLKREIDAINSVINKARTASIDKDTR